MADFFYAFTQPLRAQRHPRPLHRRLLLPFRHLSGDQVIKNVKFQQFQFNFLHSPFYDDYLLSADPYYRGYRSYPYRSYFGRPFSYTSNSNEIVETSGGNKTYCTSLLASPFYSSARESSPARESRAASPFRSTDYDILAVSDLGGPVRRQDRV